MHTVNIAVLNGVLWVRYRTGALWYLWDRSIGGMYCRSYWVKWDARWWIFACSKLFKPMLVCFYSDFINWNPKAWSFTEMTWGHMVCFVTSHGRMNNGFPYQCAHDFVFMITSCHVYKRFLCYYPIVRGISVTGVFHSERALVFSLFLFSTSFWTNIQVDVDLRRHGAHVTLLYLCDVFIHSALWSLQMETFSALLAICAGNSPVPGEFPAQRPVTSSVDVFFDLRLNKRLSKQSWGWWFETLSCPLWRHRNGFA